MTKNEFFYAAICNAKYVFRDGEDLYFLSKFIDCFIIKLD